MSSSTDKPKFKRYWPVPPVPGGVYQYQNVNKDINLRKDVTNFFHKKIIKWINTYSEFEKHKTDLSFIQSIEGKMYIYNLLRKFIKNSGINWYDLRDNYAIIKNYFKLKL